MKLKSQFSDDDLLSGEANDERRQALARWQPDPIHAHAASSRAHRLVDTVALVFILQFFCCLCVFLIVSFFFDKKKRYTNVNHYSF